MFRHPLSKKVYHIKASPEQVSPKILVCGDPGRVEAASSLLDGATVVNRHRGYLVVTGEYRGERVTLATHGIGAPSAAIVFEELAMLGAKVMIRAGTCGGLTPIAESGKIALIEAAAYENSGTLYQYFGGVSMPAYATPEVVLTLESVLREKGLSFVRGIALSHDAFHKVEENARRWASLGVDFLEMESATLFALGRLRGVKVGAMALVVDNLLSGSELVEGREELELKMVEAGLEALRRMKV
ncbi:purine-nucleoside phosphorylase [Thermofilum pendens]|uniref:Purine and other phosphorylases, family 1 n=1 Tax=Thermofilum pendens (strain DSM 2475 / Hrk 5) TaxID=368408 RepID=A1RWF6_THEPD|nr:purine-nucleoside phosphorylase [Thermofilum pendens]ABL77536.1 purine and other phosphorylases, family 1 [Thermofilum pendens Hrk 5]